MRGQYTVQIATGPSSEAHRLALVSLPERWRVNAPRRTADVAVVATALEAVEAVASGASVVVIAEPTALTEDDINAVLLAAENGVTIAVLCELVPRLKADPVVTGTEWSIIDSVVEVETSEQFAFGLFEQLSALRFLVGKITHVEMMTSLPTHYVASVVVANGAMVTLTGVATGIGRRNVSIDVIGTGRRLAIEVDLRATAHPAEITSYDETGTRQSWPIHQSGLRLSWSSLAEALVDGTDIAWTLQNAEEDLRTVNRLLRVGTN